MIIDIKELAMIEKKISKAFLLLFTSTIANPTKPPVRVPDFGPMLVKKNETFR